MAVEDVLDWLAAISDLLFALAFWLFVAFVGVGLYVRLWNGRHRSGPPRRVPTWLYVSWLIVLGMSLTGRLAGDRDAGGPVRLERPDAGFALTLPSDWEYADAADADPSEWWVASPGRDPEAIHAEWLADGLLLLARAWLPDEQTGQSCRLSDFTARAVEPPAFESIGDAWLLLPAYREDPDVLAAEASNVDLPSGRSVRIDVRWGFGRDDSFYYFLAGSRWFLLDCGTMGSPPEDRWYSIAETFEFLPEEG